MPLPQLTEKMEHLDLRTMDFYEEFRDFEQSCQTRN
jgi:hypothetical protein